MKLIGSIISPFVRKIAVNPAGKGHYL
ncbi:hypothetical protein ETR_22841 [Erwinia tracheiphila PSU-1]|nr:hypothetical protein ETR_22841 [Erwinia tracheiphila PSU-1]